MVNKGARSFWLHYLLCPWPALWWNPGMSKKVLFIGGSGNISTACSRLAAERDIDLVHFNRGQRRVELPARVRTFHGDINDRRAMAQALASETFDVVVNWMVFDPAQAASDVEMFAGKIQQYVFISTAT